MEKSKDNDLDKSSEYAMLAKNLARNTDVLEKQFEKYGLTVSSYGFEISESNLSDKKTIIYAMVEIISTGFDNLGDDNYEVCVNLYDENGSMVGTSKHNSWDGGRYSFLNNTNFDGIGVYKAATYGKNIEIYAHKARIYIIKVEK